MRLPRLVGSLALLYNGEIYSHPRVQFYRARCVRADSDQPTLIEIDGEPLGRLPIEISVVPKAIPVLM
jgi:diacylglycerol kinase (ATP)